MLHFFFIIPIKSPLLMPTLELSASVLLLLAARLRMALAFMFPSRFIECCIFTCTLPISTLPSLQALTSCERS